MADSVRVQFSASIGALIDGVEDAKNAINSVRASVDNVNEGAKSLLETFGAAFSVRELAEFVDQMATGGEQIERMSAMLGASTKDTQEFGYIAKQTGGDAESMAGAMERFEVALQKAQNPTSQQAQALKAFGLSASELIRLPLPEQMNKFADAVSKFADGPAKTAAVGQISRGFVQMIPVLDQGSAGMERLRQQAENTGAVLTTETVTSLARLDGSLGMMRASLTAAAATLTGLTAGTLSSFAEGVATSAGHLTMLAATGNLAEYTLGYLDNVVNNLGYRFVQLGHAIANIGTGNFSGIADQWNADTKRMIASSNEQQVDLDGILNRSIDGYKKLLVAQNEATKPQVSSVNVNSKDAMSAQVEQYQNKIKLADDAYKSTQEKLGAEVKLHEISADQETQQLLAALDQRHAAETAAVNAEIALYPQGTAGYQKALDERRVQDQKYAADHQKIMDQAAEKDAQIWKSAADQVAGAFNSQVLKLIQGQETFGQAMKKISGDIVLKFIQDQIKVTAEYLFNQARQLATTVATQTDMTAATTAGSAARTAASTVSGETSIVQTVANALKSIFAGAGQTAAGVAANVAPVAGPAAPAIGAAAGAAVAATATGLVSQDLGSWDVPGIVPALLHPNEMVIPKTFADGLRGAMTGEQGGSGPGMMKAIGRMMTAHEAAMNQMVSSHKQSNDDVKSELVHLRRAMKR